MISHGVGENMYSGHYEHLGVFAWSHVSIEAIHIIDTVSSWFFSVNPGKSREGVLIDDFQIYVQGVMEHIELLKAKFSTIYPTVSMGEWWVTLYTYVMYTLRVVQWQHCLLRSKQTSVAIYYTRKETLIRQKQKEMNRSHQHLHYSCILAETWRSYMGIIPADIL